MNISTKFKEKFFGKHAIRLGIIVMVIFLGFVIPYFGVTQSQIFIIVIALICGIIGLNILMQYPNLGFILMIVGGMFIHYAGPGGVNVTVLIGLAVIFLWFMDMFIVKRKFQFIHSRVMFPLFFFLVISVIAFGMGQISWIPYANQAPLDAQIGGFIIYFLAIATTIVSADLLTRDARWLQIIVFVFLGLSAVFLFGRTLNLKLVDDLYYYEVYLNSMFWVWIVALSLSQVIFNTKLEWKVKSLLLLITIMALYDGFFKQYDWKSGWLPSFVVVSVLLGLRFWKVAIYIAPIALLFSGILARDLISTDLYSWGTRIDAWIIVLKISQLSPFLGLGFANYYWYTPFFPIRGYYISFNSHSQIVDIIAQTGIVGLIGFIFIFIELIRLSWNLTIKLPPGFERGYAYGVFAGLMGSLMAIYLVDWILPFTYNIGLNGMRASILPWIFFGGLISIEQIYFANQKNTNAIGLRERRLRPVKA